MTDQTLQTCSTDMPMKLQRRAAMVALKIASYEETSRSNARTIAFWQQFANNAQEQAKREHEQFLKAAKFSAELFRQNEQRREGNEKLVAILNEQQARYRTLYGLAQQAINLADTAIRNSPTSSAPLLQYYDFQPPPITIIQSPCDSPKLEAPVKSPTYSERTLLHGLWMTKLHFARHTRGLLPLPNGLDITADLIQVRKVMAG
jgi:hypothetical protein